MNFHFILMILLVAASSCRMRQADSDLLILHGEKIPWDERPEVVRLHIYKGDEGSVCTGFVVSPVAVFTAGHCVVHIGAELLSKKGGIPIYLVDESGKKYLQADHVLLHPSYVWAEENDRRRTKEFDIAVLIFNEAAANFTDFLKLSQTPPRKGVPVEIIGVGNTKAMSNETWGNNWKEKEGDQYQKYKGANTLDIESPMLKIEGSERNPEKGAVALRGDSGSPIISLLEGRAIGVNSWWSWEGYNRASLYVDLYHPLVRDFLAKHAAEAQIEPWVKAINGQLQWKVFAKDKEQNQWSMSVVRSSEERLRVVLRKDNEEWGTYVLELSDPKTPDWHMFAHSSKFGLNKKLWISFSFYRSTSWNGRGTVKFESYSLGKSRYLVDEVLNFSDRYQSEKIEP